MPIGENGVCVAPRCDTSAECGPKECCVSIVRPIGKRDTLLQPRGRCQPMGEEGKGNRSQRNIIELIPCVDPEGLGDQASGPLENRNATGFLIDTGPITKLPSQHSMLGHDRPTNDTPFKWHLGGGPMMAHF